MHSMAQPKDALSALREAYRPRTWRLGPPMRRAARFWAALCLVAAAHQPVWAATLAPVDADSAGRWSQNVRNTSTTDTGQLCVIRDGGDPKVSADVLGCTGTTSAVAAGATVAIAAQLPAGQGALSIRAVAINFAPAGSSAAPAYSAPSADVRVVNRGAVVPTVPLLLP